jgi:hypothetical protein
MIKYIHFNDKKPEFHNVLIDDLKSNKGHIYDSDKDNFKVILKSELIDEIIENRLNDIEEFYELNSDILKNTTKTIITKYLNKIVSEIDRDNSKYIKDKKNKLEILMYNERDIVKNTKNKLIKKKKENKNILK